MKGLKASLIFGFVFNQISRHFTQSAPTRPRYISQRGARSQAPRKASFSSLSVCVSFLRPRSWQEATRWYEQAILVVQEEEIGENPLLLDSNYQLYAKQAALYRAGGFGLAKDPQNAGDLYSTAGDEAMAAMKGKLANKYYALAEEAWGEVEE